MSLGLVLQFRNHENYLSSHFIITLDTLTTACLILNSPNKGSVGAFSTRSSRKFVQMFELYVVSPCASLGPDSSGEFITREAKLPNITAFPQMEVV